MTWGWQDLITLGIVAVALGYLARKFVPGLSRKSAGGCAHCPSKTSPNAGSCCDAPVVITLGTNPVGRKKL